jgi:WhiB family transcriptional regulator, redox-sensing transcriptional regulator
MTTTDWRHDAACLGHDPEVFFPAGQSGSAWLELERAKAICRPCPVRERCLHWAVETGQTAGVWGGLSEHERRLCARRHDSGPRTGTG